MNVFTEFLLPAIVALIMLSMGLALRVQDFAEVLKKPKAFAIGFASQLIALPIIGFSIATLWPMPGVIAAGLMIVAACPGGPMSNLLTHLAHGDTALSISLTATTSLLSIITLPFIVGLSLPHFMGKAAPPLPIAGTILGLSIMTLLPVCIGMLIRRQTPRFALRIEPYARRAAALVFILFVIAAVIIEWDLVQTNVTAIAPTVITLNICAMTFAYALAKSLSLQPDRVIALTLECGIQNGSLAMFVAATLLRNDEMMLPGAAYGLFMFPTALLFVGFVLRTERRHAMMKVSR